MGDSLAKPSWTLPSWEGAFCLAFLLRFEGSLPAHDLETMIGYLPFVVIGRLLLLTLGGRLWPAWRYTSLPDAMAIFYWLAAASVVLLVWRLLLEMVVSGREQLLQIRFPSV